jgi:hypothetical protein
MIARKHIAPALLGLAQLGGQTIGSTTFSGACIYEIVTIGWWVWMICTRQWGFLPLNLGGLIVSTWVLWDFFVKG